MVSTVVLLVFLAVVSVAYEDRFPHNHGLLEAIEEIGEAATELMDLETRMAFYIAHKRIKSVVKSTKMNNGQLSAAMNLVRFISGRMKEGKIRIGHIQHFIDFVLSDKLSKLLSTWDKELLKKP